MSSATASPTTPAGSEGTPGSPTARPLRRLWRLADPDRARLALAGSELLQPGQTEVTRAFVEGIHKTGNPSAASLIMISVYGRTLRRRFLQLFDPDTGRVQAIYPPRVRKQMLAEQALKAIQGDTRQRPNATART
jgi:hypothetical protein